jgi:hypothetical protein
MIITLHALERPLSQPLVQMSDAKQVPHFEADHNNNSRTI